MRADVPHLFWLFTIKLPPLTPPSQIPQPILYYIHLVWLQFNVLYDKIWWTMSDYLPVYAATVRADKRQSIQRCPPTWVFKSSTGWIYYYYIQLEGSILQQPIAALLHFFAEFTVATGDQGKLTWVDSSVLTSICDQSSTYTLSCWHGLK